eukprot:gene6841-8280_t
MPPCCNVTGRAVLSGLSQGLAPPMAQAWGAGNAGEVGTLYYRGLFIL